MRNACIKSFNKFYDMEIKLKEEQKGRNKDINVKDMLNEDNYLTRLNNAFETDKITKVPVILYYKDGKVVNIVHRNDNNVINAGDFQKLLDIYEYQGQ